MYPMGCNKKIFPSGTIQIAIQGPQDNNVTFLTLCQILQVPLLFFFTFLLFDVFQSGRKNILLTVVKKPKLF